MRRPGIPTALIGGLAFLLAGCSLLPQLSNNSSRDDDEDDDASEVVELKARDLDGFFDADDAPSVFRIDLDYSTEDGSDWADDIADYWDESKGSEDGCFDSYAASFLVGDSDDDDDHVKIALNNSESGYSYASVDGRVFDDADAAEDYFGVVSDAADECSDAGGYDLFDDEGEQIWAVSGVSVDDADDLDLPDGVNAIIQEEDVDADFAESYRVIMLQRGNVIVAVTVQPAGDGEFDAEDGDELAELVAEELADLD